MPATRKISREAQQQDLAQLKDCFTSKIQTEVKETPDLASLTQKTNSEPFTTQVSVQSENTGTPVTAIQAEEIEGPASEEQPQNATTIPATEKETLDTSVGIRMTKQKRRELKAYFIQKGTTLSQGIMEMYELMKVLEKENVFSFVDGQIVRNKH